MCTSYLNSENPHVLKYLARRGQRGKKRVIQNPKNKNLVKQAIYLKLLVEDKARE